MPKTPQKPSPGSRAKPPPHTPDEDLDEALDGSFPASDPPSQIDPTKSIKRRPNHKPH
jgi:hypothetical protein